MTAHFIITGYLFASVLVGVDPGPRRPPYPFRMIILMATFGFHAFFAVSLMSGTEVIGRAWFESLGRTWGRSLIEEQNLGGAMSWALGDYPIAILAFAMIYSWIRADGDCPKNGVSGSTRRPVVWRGGVTDDRNTGGREPIED